MSSLRLLLFSLFALQLGALSAGAQAPSSATPAPMLPAAAPQSGPAIPHVIKVSGSGEVQAAPDLATLEVAIETHAATADRAAGLNGALAQKVRYAINSKLDNKGKMWTGGYSLFPEYSEPRNGRSVLTGYRAQNSITVQTGALDLIGPLIDTAIAAGANQINSLNYSLREDSKARSEAIAKAAHDAQTQAQALANALGVKLGIVVEASTESEVHPVPVGRFMAASAMAVNAPTPVQPGQITVPATVSLTYRIE